MQPKIHCRVWSPQFSQNQDIGYVLNCTKECLGKFISTESKTSVVLAVTTSLLSVLLQSLKN